MKQVPTLKYYRRGTGELDTSNFPEIAHVGKVIVDHLDSRTIVSLSVLDEYLGSAGYFPTEVIVGGYVCHMRADKDLFDPAKIYTSFEHLTFNCLRVQHDSRYGIKTGMITKHDIDRDTGMISWFTRYLGADSSVHKFFPEVESEAQKIREGGKVTDLKLDLTLESLRSVTTVVIVDDILGGGATIQSCVDRLRELGYEGQVSLWVEWNEGIHKPEFLEQFDKAYVGRNIYEVN